VLPASAACSADSYTLCALSLPNCRWQWLLVLVLHSHPHTHPQHHKHRWVLPTARAQQAMAWEQAKQAFRKLLNENLMDPKEQARTMLFSAKMKQSPLSPCVTMWPGFAPKRCC
jgi:hypothetical protein